VSAVTDEATPLDAEAAVRLLTICRSVEPQHGQHRLGADQLLSVDDGAMRDREAAIRRLIGDRSARVFEAEADKLDGWVNDLKLGFEREIKELDRRIKEARRAGLVTVSLEDKLPERDLTRCEWGRDDDNVEVTNLKPAPTPPGQPALVLAD
jgi:adenine-specific DNA-methyltransferase